MQPASAAATSHNGRQALPQQSAAFGAALMAAATDIGPSKEQAADVDHRPRPEEKTNLEQQPSKVEKSFDFRNGNEEAKGADEGDGYIQQEKNGVNNRRPYSTPFDALIAVASSFDQGPPAKEQTIDRNRRPDDKNIFAHPPPMVPEAEKANEEEGKSTADQGDRYEQQKKNKVNNGHKMVGKYFAMC